MAMFENFPYTNLHELNLDWIINELNRIKDTTVLSVNGQTGDVILYENATVQFPNVPQDHWSIIRMANGTDRGIMFGNDNKAYVVHGNLMSEIFSQNNPPTYPVTSVNGQTGDVVLFAENTVRLPDLDDISLHNWNIFRKLNNVFRGIQFNEDGTAEIIDGLQRYQLYSSNNPPAYPVTSVNGQTGDVNLFTDNNGVIAFPAITNPNVAGWIMGRQINGDPYYIQLESDGTLSLTVGSNTYFVYTTQDMQQDVIEVPEDSNSDAWGLVRTTTEGSVGILFSNDPLLTEPEAYIRYVDSNDIVHTEKLLTAADIPSASGVVSFNGMTGVVVVKGSDLIVSTTDTRTIAQAISDSATSDYAIKSAVAYVENTNTATQNIPAGSYVIWQNNDYLSTQDISIGNTLSGSNLSAISAGGITNNLTATNEEIKSSVAFVENSDTATHNIPEGSYVLWKNEPYIANQAISASDALSASNLSAISTGGITNIINDRINDMIRILTFTTATASIPNVTPGCLICATRSTNIGFYIVATTQLIPIYESGNVVTFNAYDSDTKTLVLNKDGGASFRILVMTPA